MESRLHNAQCSVTVESCLVLWCGSRKGPVRGRPHGAGPSPQGFSGRHRVQVQRCSQNRFMYTNRSNVKRAVKAPMRVKSQADKAGPRSTHAPSHRLHTPYNRSAAVKSSMACHCSLALLPKVGCLQC